MSRCSSTVPDARRSVAAGRDPDLPGIAGIALTMGMAVDANVLIYERIREEMRGGRTMLSALEAGFKRALATISTPTSPPSSPLRSCSPTRKAMVASGVVNGAAAARANALCAFNTARHTAMHALIGSHRIKARNRLVVIRNFSAEKLEPNNGKSHGPPAASNEAYRQHRAQNQSQSRSREHARRGVSLVGPHPDECRDKARSEGSGHDVGEEGGKQERDHERVQLIAGAEIARGHHDFGGSGQLGGGGQNAHQGRVGEDALVRRAAFGGLGGAHLRTVSHLHECAVFAIAAWRFRRRLCRLVRA